MSTNRILNQSPNWIGCSCVRCGRSFPQTTLNVMAVISRGASLVCEDQKSCGKVASMNHTREHNKKRYHERNKAG